MIVRRGKAYHLKIKPFGHPIWVRTLALTYQEAREIERAVLVALRVDDFRSLWPEAREVCLRIFENQGWTIPDDLGPKARPAKELTLWDAATIFFDYPSIKHAKAKERYTYALGHVIEAWGKEKPVKSIRVADVREYQTNRIQSGASPSTVNWEKGTLSKLFQVLVELDHVESNPVRQVKNLSQKPEERQVYLSLEDVGRIAGRCPDWFKPILWTAFYTGMRRGEILDLTRNRVNLSRRMIYLGPEDTKEAHWKRVPVHGELVPIFADAMKVSAFGSDKVFLLTDNAGTRAPQLEAVRNCWPRACQSLGLEKPWPRFHDLRAAWRTNARRSGVDPQIAESILGHYFKGKTVNDRYGFISDEELIQAIDRMTFDHGESMVLVAKSALKATDGDKGSKGVAKPSPKKKGHVAA
jgi:integrase